MQSKAGTDGGLPVPASLRQKEDWPLKETQGQVGSDDWHFEVATPPHPALQGAARRYFAA